MEWRATFILQNVRLFYPFYDFYLAQIIVGINHASVTDESQLESC